MRSKNHRKLSGSLQTKRSKPVILGGNPEPFPMLGGIVLLHNCHQIDGELAVYFHGAIIYGLYLIIVFGNLLNLV